MLRRTRACAIAFVPINSVLDFGPWVIFRAKCSMPNILCRLRRDMLV
jgi:hypothetical protein